MLKTLALGVALALGACATATDGPITGSAVPQVGGAAMYPDRTIAANLRNSAVHFTLIRMIEGTDLAATLDAAGEYTLFAPTDRAFERLPAGTIDTLLVPEARDRRAALLAAHIVPGRITAADIRAAIRAGRGTATYTTLAGTPLALKADRTGVLTVESSRGAALVTQRDVRQANGVVHVVNGVLSTGP